MARDFDFLSEQAYEDTPLPADLGLESVVPTAATPIGQALPAGGAADAPVGIQTALPGATQTAPAQTFEKRTRWVTDPSGYDQQSRLEEYELPTFGYTALSGQAPQALQGLQGWEFDQGGDGGIANWETMATGTNQLAVNYAIDPQTGERTGLDPGYGLKDASGLVHGVKFANQHRISQFFDPTTGKPVGKPVIQYIDPGENLGKILAIAPAFLNTLIPGVPLGSLITAAQTAGKVGSGEQVGLGEVANLVGVGSDVTGLKELKTAADAIKTAGQVQALEKAVKSGDVLGIASLGTDLLGKAGIDVPSDVKDTISTVNKYSGIANVVDKALKGDVVSAVNLAMLGAKEFGGNKYTHTDEGNLEKVPEAPIDWAGIEESTRIRSDIPLPKGSEDIDTLLNELTSTQPTVTTSVAEDLPSELMIPTDVEADRKNADITPEETQREIDSLLGRYEEPQKGTPIGLGEREKFLEANIESPKDIERLMQIYEFENEVNKPFEETDWAKLYGFKPDTGYYDPDGYYVHSEEPPAPIDTKGLEQNLGITPENFESFDKNLQDIFENKGGFTSQWQTVGSDRVMIQDDGTAIGINTETNEPYALDEKQVQGMIDAGMLNTDKSGYYDAIGKEKPAEVKEEKKPEPKATGPSPKTDAPKGTAPSTKTEPTAQSNLDLNALFAALAAMGGQQAAPEPKQELFTLNGLKDVKDIFGKNWFS